MDQLLGFAVLTSPLFIIVLWLPVCIALAVWVGRKFAQKSLPVKIAGAVAVLLVAIPLPFADEIAGRIYFNHLCETEAGVKVYQTIELPAEQWDENGKPRFYKGANNNDVPSYAFDRLGIDVKAQAKKRVRLFGVEQHGSTFTDEKTGHVLSEVTGFHYWGGWVARNFSPHNTAISCGSAKYYDQLVDKQFVPVNTQKR